MPKIKHYKWHIVEKNLPMRDLAVNVRQQLLDKGVPPQDIRIHKRGQMFSVDVLIKVPLVKRSRAKDKSSVPESEQTTVTVTEE